MGILLLNKDQIPAIMKTVFVLALFIAVAAAAAYDNTCEQKNEILKKAIVKMVKAQQPKLDCSTCIGDITAAATDCILSLAIINCILDIIDGANPCVDCVCEVITDIGNLFDQDWSC